MEQNELAKYNYFGTDTTRAGHYFWILGEGQHSSSLSPFKLLPFNPEEFTKQGKWDFKKKGSVEIHKNGDYSILAISGSAIDQRSGCKSVFFFKQDLDKNELVAKIKSIPSAMKIIKTMPFPIEDNLFETNETT